MKQIQITDSVLIVELPKGSFNYGIREDKLWYEYMELAWASGEPSHEEEQSDYIQLPSSDYTHLTPVPELSEDECAGMVEEPEEGYYKNYLFRDRESFIFPLAIQSLQSRLLLEGFTPSNCYAVFKR